MLPARSLVYGLELRIIPSTTGMLVIGLTLGCRREEMVGRLHMYVGWRCIWSVGHQKLIPKPDYRVLILNNENWIANCRLTCLVSSYYSIASDLAVPRTSECEIKARVNFYCICKIGPLIFVLVNSRHLEYLILEYTS